MEFERPIINQHYSQHKRISSNEKMDLFPILLLSEGVENIK